MGKKLVFVIFLSLFLAACSNPLARSIQRHFLDHPASVNGPVPKQIIQAVEKNTDLDGLDSDVCKTPLQIAIKWGSYNTVRFLVEKGANINSLKGCHYSDMTLVAYAIHSEEYKIAQYLFNKGGEFNKYYTNSGYKMDVCEDFPKACKPFLKSADKKAPSASPLFRTFSKHKEVKIASPQGELESFKIIMQANVKKLDSAKMMKFSDDGRFILLGTQSGVSVFNRQGVTVFSELKAAVSDAAISPDNSQIAAISNSSVTIWSTVDDYIFQARIPTAGRSNNEIVEHEGYISFISNTRLILTTNFGLYSLDIEDQQGEFKLLRKGTYWHMQVSLNKKRILLCDRHVPIVLDEQFKVFLSPDSTGFCGRSGRTVTMSLDGDYLFSADAGELKVFNLKEKNHPNPLKTIQLNGNYDHIFASINGETLAITKNRGFNQNIINFVSINLKPDNTDSINLNNTFSQIAMDSSFGYQRDRLLAFSPNGEEFFVKNEMDFKLYNGNGTHINFDDSSVEDIPVISSIAFSPDKNYLAAAFDDKSLAIWSSEGKLVKRFYNTGNVLRRIAFVSKGSDNSEKKLCVRSSLALESHIKIGEYGGYEICGATYTYGDSIFVYADFTNVALKDPKIKRQLKNISYQPSKSKGLDGLSKHSEIRYRKQPELKLAAYDISLDGEVEALVFKDNTIKINNLMNHSSYYMYSIDNEWVIYNDEMFFDSSRNIGSKIKFTSALKAYEIDNFALQYNRPDLVLKNVWNTSDILIKEMQRLSLKRNNKYLTASNNTRPSISNVKFDIINNKLKYEFTASDDTFIKSYNIYVNGSPSYGVKGLNIEDQNDSQISGEITLSSGRNIVEIEVTNSYNVKSIRSSHEVTGKHKDVIDVYFVGIGVSKYKDKNLNLNYAAKDILDLESILNRTKESNKVRNVYTKTLTDRDVTRNNINELKFFLDKPRENDIVIMLVAGHGIRENGIYYYLTHESNIRDISSSSPNFGVFEGLLTHTRARSKIVLLDTCESGDTIDQKTDSYFEYAKNNNANARTTRYAVLRGLKRKQSKAASSDKISRFRFGDRYISNNLNRRTGAVIFSSSQGDEFSYESHVIKNGYFTSAIIKALTSTSADTDLDGMLSKNELRKYVADSVAELSDDMQHPVLDRDNLLIDFKLPILSK